MKGVSSFTYVISLVLTSEHTSIHTQKRLFSLQFGMLKIKCLIMLIQNTINSRSNIISRDKATLYEGVRWMVGPMVGR